jgi:hypothetical protein
MPGPLSTFRIIVPPPRLVAEYFLCNFFWALSSFSFLFYINPRPPTQIIAACKIVTLTAPAIPMSVSRKTSPRF